MPRRASKHNIDKNYTSFEQLIQRWILGILIPLEGYKYLLRESDFRFDDVARRVGLSGYIDTNRKTPKYDRLKIIDKLLLKWSESQQRKYTLPCTSTFDQNLYNLGATLELNEAELRILHFSTHVRLHDVLQSAISCAGTLSLNVLKQIFAACLDLEPDDVNAALSYDGKLYRAGILWLDLSGNYEFIDKVELLKGFVDELHMNHDDPIGLFCNNLVSSLPAKLTEGHYAHLAKDIKTLLQYLGKPGDSRKTGTNILIYGPPGTGKTEFVRMIAKESGFHLFDVATENRKGFPLDGDNRFRGYRLAQSLLEGRNDALIMFDEIEDVFRETGDDAIGKGNQSGHKGWVNRMLEENATPAFWITNNLHYMDPAFLRRFDYVIEINSPPRSVRSRILDDYLAGLPVSDGWKRQMAEHENLVPAVVERAAKVVRSVKDGLAPLEMELTLARAMGNTLEAMGLARAPKPLTSWETKYRIDILNTDCDIAEIQEGLAQDPRGRLCLYGPPGTGKTAFGRYIAETLDRPLHVKRASDILSPLVGVAEKNMARMFHEAADDGAILLLDEADTYLQDRKGAQRTWEISEVNEMLTQMESFEGVFIASTNLMSSLDEAALRRFDLKIRFGYLKPEQAWSMFCDMALKLGIKADQGVKPLVAKLTLLTPGDFAAVSRQARFRKIKDSQDLYGRLASECTVKPEGLKRAIGF